MLIFAWPHSKFSGNTDPNSTESYVFSFIVGGYVMVKPGRLFRVVADVITGREKRGKKRESHTKRRGKSLMEIRLVNHLRVYKVDFFFYEVSSHIFSSLCINSTSLYTGHTPLVGQLFFMNILFWALEGIIYAREQSTL